MQTNNDNYEKLLKMKERLILAARNNKSLENTNLEEYIKIAKIVDENNLNNLVDQIKAYNQENTKEEEYSFLEQIEDKYEEIEIKRSKIINTCKNYQEVTFSNLNIIDIEEIRKRKNNINGYLLTKNKIISLEEELAKLNNELFKENKKYSQNKTIINKLEQELINNFINAEGRIINDGKYEYSSVLEEYKKIDIDLTKINQNLLKQMLITNESIKKEKDELLHAANICYETLPTKENKLTFEEISKETNIANYNLCLLKIANMIFEIANNYEVAKNKRYQIKDLIKYRKEYLHKMGIIYFIDQMDRIKIDEQLKEIEQIEDNTKEAFRINKRIKEINTSLELLNEDLIKYNNELDKEINFIRDDITNKKIEDNYITEDVESKKYMPNEVVSIKECNDNLNIPIVESKTQKVINRVFEMTNKSEEVPQIEKNNNMKLDEENPIISIEEVYNEAIQEKTQVEETKPIEIKDEDLFKTVTPFEDVKLFDDKKDNVSEEIAIEKISKEEAKEEITEESLLDKMPEMFWNIEEDKPKIEGKLELQLDELPFLTKNIEEKRKVLKKEEPNN